MQEHIQGAPNEQEQETARERMMQTVAGLTTGLKVSS
jgi:hypothetical protein